MHPRRTEHNWKSIPSIEGTVEVNVASPRGGNSCRLRRQEHTDAVLVTRLSFSTVERHGGGVAVRVVGTAVAVTVVTVSMPC